tara:strand:+ start:82 stop:1278 length:1197 start_codon:yes stop_codon:yes gene_type:complete
MKPSFYIARRYLMSKSYNNAINSMSFLAVFGVLISSAALFVVLSGFSGLKEYTLGFVSYASPDLQASAASGKSFSLSDADFAKLVSQPEFSSVYRAIQERVFLKTNKNSQIVQLNGVDERFPLKIVDSLVVEGRWFASNEREVVVGWGVANSLGIETFDNINMPLIYAPKPGSGQLLSVSDAFRSESFLSVGVFEINEELNNTEVYAPLEAAQKLLGYKGDQLSSVNFYFSPETQEAVAVEKIKSIIGDSFVFKNRVAQHDTLYKMLNTEQAAVYLIFTLVVAIALFNVVGALIMMILEKREDLKVLVGLGYLKSQVSKIFFYQGVMISGLGAVFGLLIGYCLIILQDSFSLFMITPSLAYPVSVSIKSFLVVFVTVMSLGATASFIASSQTTKAFEN